MELNKSNMKKIMLLIAFGIAFYLGLKNLYRFSDLAGFIGSIFEPFLLGMAFAFILNILMRHIETRFFAPLNRRYTQKWPKIRRPLSIFLSLLIVLGIIALILLIVVPELIKTIVNLTNNIPNFFNEIQNYLTRISNQYPDIGESFRKINIDWNSISQMLAVNGQKLASSLVGSTVTVTTNIFHGAITLVLSFVIALNILAQKEKLQGQAKRVLYAYLPNPKAQKIVWLCRLSNKTFSNFIAGQCTEACILGTLCFIGMNIFQFPYALLISVFVVFMALIPIIGSFLSTVIGALLILIVSPIKAVWYVVFFVVLQQLEGNLIYPRVVGSKVGLPVLWVLAAITIGGNVFGVLGMVINIPICSILYVLLKEDVGKRLKSKKKQDKPVQDTGE
ncbi:AI-2E family transporter [Caproiciproducens galactitolivorans]|uniref:AI-2E family transporter n=1 Tax=Caproiciproducens galactitolivorans TaxID=642589 RepID=A0ABT4BV09_9FIRM|nr:AI-2E family transporter [Caproiciproducens galactitolivorans]MCY1714175.1 AI-2E family transporter [Caproiciproducens galactitolivorans]